MASPVSRPAASKIRALATTLATAVMTLGLLTTTGCGAVQHAVIGTAIDIPPQPSRLEEAGAPRPAAITAPHQAGASTSRFVVRAEESHLGITVGDLFGTYHARLTRYRGQIVLPTDDGLARMKLTFDMESVRAEMGVVTATLQYEFLEIEQYPTAHLDGILVPVSACTAPCQGAQDVRVEGTLELHGVKRHISFKGKLWRDDAGLRFTSIFDLNRHPFGIRRHDSFDWMAKDDFRVELALRGTPEHVRAEEIP